MCCLYYRTPLPYAYEVGGFFKTHNYGIFKIKKSYQLINDVVGEKVVPGKRLYEVTVKMFWE